MLPMDTGFRARKEELFNAAGLSEPGKAGRTLRLILIVPVSQDEKRSDQRNFCGTRVAVSRSDETTVEGSGSLEKEFDQQNLSRPALAR